MFRFSPRPDVRNANCKTLRDVQLSYAPLSILYDRARPTPDQKSDANISSVLDISIDGTVPIAQSTPHTSFIESSDPVLLLDTSRRRALTRNRVSSTPPVTPVPRRRIPAITYSPSSDVGRLVIDEGSTAGPADNATAVVPGTTHEDLDISWLTDQQTRLNYPPGSNQ